MPHPMIIVMKLVEANRTIDFLYAEEMCVLCSVPRKSVPVKRVLKFS